MKTDPGPWMHSLPGVKIFPHVCSSASIQNWPCSPTSGSLPETGDQHNTKSDVSHLSPPYRKCSRKDTSPNPKIHFLCFLPQNNPPWESSLYVYLGLFPYLEPVVEIIESMTYCFFGFLLSFYPEFITFIFFS